MARVIRTQRAQEDLEGILDYLDTQSPEIANRFFPPLSQLSPKR